MPEATRKALAAMIDAAVTAANAGKLKAPENTGQNPRAIQQAMGHQSLDTTMGYLHAEAMSVRSPLDQCAAALNTNLG